ncbi:hypothetical protein Ddye_000737 [Dipteronia dyeriana]|uniref:Uncharacterized protein n=1 Tax=Dipteronia dyeriana TaxID=168575 RepID=A0AAD9XMV4_9ROSI|nr:hypothetical protein Ddye_000737 [Dipteronia dyeriana]
MGVNRYDFNTIAKAKEIEVPINDLGQPYGESSIQLSTCCVAVAAQLIPITYKSWLEVIEIMKERVWETTKEISRCYSELAKKNETPHTTSRKRFARLREELAQMETIPLDKTKSIKDDVVAQVLGNEHQVRVRRLGLGVTPTRVHAVMIGKTTTMQFQAEMKDLRQLVRELQNAFNNQTNDRVAAEERVHQSPLGVYTSEKDASPQKGTKCKLLH